MLPALSLLLPSTQAAPTFVGEPSDVAVASAAWFAGTQCAGREGRAVDSVHIKRRTITGQFLGAAFTDPSGRLVEIALDREHDNNRSVLVHEVAHAWISDGPLGLVEGATEWLAECMAQRAPGLASLQHDNGSDLGNLVDLLAWAHTQDDAPADLASTVTDSYIASSRLMRTASLLIDPADLWSGKPLTWEGFADQLAASGPHGKALWEALQAGPAAQQQALHDRDRDGLPAFAELILGTDPQRFDTDSDGWWDGAQSPPPLAVALPRDGTPVCAGQGTGAQVAHNLRLHTGGNVRGALRPTVRLRPAHLPPETVAANPFVGAVPAHTSLLIESDVLPLDATGSQWAQIIADSALQPDAGCRSGGDATVWATNAATRQHVDAFYEVLLAAKLAAADHLPDGPSRLAVALGGDWSTVDGNIIWFSDADVVRAFQSNDPRSLALLAIALQRHWTIGEPDWKGAVGLARHLARQIDDS